MLWLFIAGVSAFDTYLLVRWAPVLVEENPVGVALIDIGGVPLLAGTKLFGTATALGILVAMYGRVRDRITFQSTGGIALCQFLLLLYLIT